ncbi:MAG TPA: hypothetical protein VN711_00935 [Candidatus Saccharimonadales bacterium]|nr:hypothetical protein [Candidatus Saccharimonadales bacterium]
MSHKLSNTICQTLLYSELFEYPLTKDELWKYLLTSQKVAKKDFEKLLKPVPFCMIAGERFFYLPKRKYVVKKRMDRKMRSYALLGRAKKIARFLSFSPTVLMIGVSGSLAMENSNKDSDIDFFFITKDSTLWITRLFVVVVLHILGIQRKRNDTSREGAICTNMFLDETSLCLPSTKQNIYTAHEVVQLKPLINKNHTYEDFMQQNNWVKKYMVNSLDGIPFFSSILAKKPIRILCMIESFLRNLQMWYMRQHITTEIVGEHIAAFHPYDYEKIIINSFKKKQKNYV